MKANTVKTVSKTARKMAVKDALKKDPKTAPKTEAKTAEKAPKAPKTPKAPAYTLPKAIQAGVDAGEIDASLFALQANADPSVLLVALDELREMKRRVNDALKATVKYNEKHPGNRQETHSFEAAKNFLETVIEKYKGLQSAKLRKDKLATRLTWKMHAFGTLSKMTIVK